VTDRRLPHLLGAEPFDHILSNPPWHAASGTPPAPRWRRTGCWAAGSRASHHA
jgi:hypothetical protein